MGYVNAGNAAPSVGTVALDGPGVTQAARQSSDRAGRCAATDTQLGLIIGLPVYRDRATGAAVQSGNGKAGITAGASGMATIFIIAAVVVVSYLLLRVVQKF
jgi:hypothetical protein